MPEPETPFEELRAEWIDRLEDQGRLDTALVHYQELIDDCGLATAITEVRVSSWGAPAAPSPPSQPSFNFSPASGSMDVLIKMRDNLQWALDNFEGTGPAPNPTARAYREDDIQKLSEMLLKVTIQIEKSAGPVDDRMEEDHRKQMGLLIKLQQEVEPDVTKQCDDMIRLNLDILTKRLKRAGYELEMA
jgi:hypothetical protein